MPHHLPLSRSDPIDGEFSLLCPLVVVVVVEIGVGRHLRGGRRSARCDLFLEEFHFNGFLLKHNRERQTSQLERRRKDNKKANNDGWTGRKRILPVEGGFCLFPSLDGRRGVSKRSYKSIGVRFAGRAEKRGSPALLRFPVATLRLVFTDRWFFLFRSSPLPSSRRAEEEEKARNH